MGKLDADDPAADTEHREVRLVAEPFDEPGGAANERLGVEQKLRIEQRPRIKIYHCGLTSCRTLALVENSMLLVIPGWFVRSAVGSTDPWWANS